MRLPRHPQAVAGIAAFPLTTGTGFIHLQLNQLFNAYCRNPGILDSYFQERIKEEGLERVVADYIAGMTDRFALQEYKKIFDPYEKI